MTLPVKSDTAHLLVFFLTVIAVGTALLCLPVSWAGSGDGRGRLQFVDALFTSTSAVCVTGLATVSTPDYSRFGQIVILLLIQTGGLGIISFTSLMLMVPGARLPFRRLSTIRSFSVGGVEHDPIRIIRDIVFFTFSLEAAGAVALYPAFSKAAVPDPLFTAVFHAVSAFCNAGFSTFPDSLEGFRRNPYVLFVMSALIVTGGIGFIVLQDISRLIRRKKNGLSYHSQLILALTAFLVLAGAAAFWFIEGGNTFAGMGPLDRAANALFQSITPRTAGFNAVRQTALRQSSKFITLILMFIGGAPGSTAGGVKVSTAYIVLLVMLKKANEYGEINSLRRRFTPSTINTAVVYFIKAAALLVLGAGVLSLVEGSRGDLGRVIFEVVSAFGTVGLSLDFTPALSVAGKLVIIWTMFAGRVGLLAFVFLGGSARSDYYVRPEADILLG